MIHCGGVIPNYKNKKEKELNNIDNVYNSFIPLQRKLFNLYDVNGHLIYFKDSTVPSYKINTDFQLEEISDEFKKIAIKLKISDKKFKIADTYYPFYYIYLDNKFKIVETLYNKNIGSREFLETLFIISEPYDGKFYTFHDINSKPNLLHKYMFINQFKFLLDIIFDPNINEQNDDKIDIKDAQIKTYINSIDKEIKELQINSDEGIKLKALIAEVSQSQLISPQEKSTELKQNYEKMSKISTPEINELIEKRKNTYNKIKNIKKKLLTIFRTKEHNKEKPELYSLENLSDLNQYQTKFFANKNINVKQMDGETKETYETRAEEYKKKEIHKYLVKHENENIFNENYMTTEILSIIGFRDNLEKITNNDNVLGLIILLSYFYKRIYVKNMIYMFSFPVNKNIALLDLFKGGKDFEENKNYLPLYNTYIDYPLYINDAIYNGNKFANCVETAILHFIRTLLWNGTDYDTQNLNDNDFKTFFEECLSNNQQINDDVHNKFIKILYKIRNLEYVVNNSYELEASWYNFGMSLGGLLYNLTTFNDNVYEDIKKDYNAVINIERNEKTKTIIITITKNDYNIYFIILVNRHIEVKSSNLVNDDIDINYFKEIIKYINYDLLLEIVKNNYIKNGTYHKNKEIVNNVKENFINAPKCFLTELITYILSDYKNDFLMTYIAMNRLSKDLVLTIIKKRSYEFENVSEELKNDKEVVMTAVDRKGLLLKFASDKLKNDKDIVMHAVNENGLSLEFASDELKNDKEVVKVAVTRNSASLKFASDELKNDKETVLFYVSINHYSIEHVSNEFKNDRDIVLTAVNKNGLLLKFASDELKNDKDIVMSAVSNNSLSLEFASDELKNDKNIVMSAVNNNGMTLDFASDELKNDEDIVMYAVNNNGNSLQFASDELTNNKKIVMSAIKNNGMSFEFVSDKLKNDMDVVLSALDGTGYSLQFMPDELKNNVDIVMIAIKTSIDAIEYASEEIKDNDEIYEYICEYVRDNIMEGDDVIDNLSPRLQKKYSDAHPEDSDYDDYTKYLKYKKKYLALKKYKNNNIF
jgi:CxxC motif-containing protein